MNYTVSLSALQELTKIVNKQVKTSTASNQASILILQSLRDRRQHGVSKSVL